MCLYTANLQPKVNVIEIQNPEHLNQLRSLAIQSRQNSSSSLEIGYLSDSVSESVGDAVDHISWHVENQPSHVQSLLPIYYAIGLWSYCEGKPNDKAFSNCSKPSAHFSFDPMDVLGTWLGPADGVTSDLIQPVLKGYDHISQWIIGAYITGFIAAFIAIVVGFVRFPMAKVAVVISSSASAT